MKWFCGCGDGLCNECHQKTSKCLRCQSKEAIAMNEKAELRKSLQESRAESGSMLLPMRRHDSLESHITVSDDMSSSEEKDNHDAAAAAAVAEGDHLAKGTGGNEFPRPGPGPAFKKLRTSTHFCADSESQASESQAHF